MFKNNILLGITLMIFICILIAYLYKVNRYIIVTSKIDHIKYQVLRLTGRQEASDRLAYIMFYMRKLISYIRKQRKNWLEYSTAIDRIKLRFPPKLVIEGAGGNSYLMEKSKKLVLVLRNKNNSFKPLRKMKRVAVHEMAHMASRSKGHNEEFTKNYNFLLEMAKQCPGFLDT